jgi:hypothetical protein
VVSDSVFGLSLSGCRWAYVYICFIVIKELDVGGIAVDHRQFSLDRFMFSNLICRGGFLDGRCAATTWISYLLTVRPCARVTIVLLVNYFLCSSVTFIKDAEEMIMDVQCKISREISVYWRHIPGWIGFSGLMRPVYWRHLSWLDWFKWHYVNGNQIQFKVLILIST